MNTQEIFSHAASTAINFNESNWNVSNVTNMNGVFYNAFRNVSSFVQDLSEWDVTDMSKMFDLMGSRASYSLDLSGWKVTLVINYSEFNDGVESKITPQVWVN